MDQLQAMIDFENGQLGEKDTILLFSDLVHTGLVWRLQGFYGRTAAELIEHGILDRSGKVQVCLEDML